MIEVGKGWTNSGLDLGASQASPVILDAGKRGRAVSASPAQTSTSLAMSAGSGRSLKLGPPCSVQTIGGHNTYTHTQEIPATVWTIQHNLAEYPAGISVFSTDLSIQWDEYGIQHLDQNNLLLSFDIQVSGIALMG